MYGLVEVDRDVVCSVLVPPQYSIGEPAAARVEDFDYFSNGVGHVLFCRALAPQSEAGFVSLATAGAALRLRGRRAGGDSEVQSRAARVHERFQTLARAGILPVLELIRFELAAVRH